MPEMFEKKISPSFYFDFSVAKKKSDIPMEPSKYHLQMDL